MDRLVEEAGFNYLREGNDYKKPRYVTIHVPCSSSPTSQPKSS